MADASDYQGLAMIVAKLTARKVGRIEDYLARIGSLYENYSYLPIAYPATAKNFAYHGFFATPSDEALEEAGKTISKLGLDADPRDPYAIATSIIYNSIKLCVDSTRPGTRVKDTKFKIGKFYVSIRGYCDVLSRAPYITLVMSSHFYLSYAPHYFIEALSDHIRRSRLFKECGENIIVNSISDIVAARRKCPEGYRAFQKYLTTWTLTGLRGFFAGLYMIKWIYDPLEILGLEPPKFVGSGGLWGIRSLYPVQPTYLGRVVSEAVEVWMHSLVDDPTIDAMGVLVFEYYRLLRRLREEVEELASRESRWVKLYSLRVLEEWKSRVKGLLSARGGLGSVSPLRVGEVVDDILAFILNERAHFEASLYEGMQDTARVFTRFGRIDYGDLIVSKTIRVRE